jgi:hypothetical protein
MPEKALFAALTMLVSMLLGKKMMGRRKKGRHAKFALL